MDRLYLYNGSRLAVLDRRSAPYALAVQIPLPLRLVGRMLGVAQTLESAFAVEWQSELLALESSIDGVLLATDLKASRARAAHELERAVARYREFLMTEAKRVGATGVAVAATSMTRLAADKALTTATLLATVDDPIEEGVLAEYWADLAEARSLLRGVGQRWLAAVAEPLPDRVRNELWWKQFLPVTRVGYVRHLEELGSREIESGQIGAQVFFKVSAPSAPTSRLTRYETELLHSPTVATRQTLIALCKRISRVIR